MNHFTVPSFWKCYDQLEDGIKKQADKCFELLKINPNHLGLHFKKIERYYSVRIGLKFRALGVIIPSGVIWFWIGDHKDYDVLLSS